MKKLIAVFMIGLVLPFTAFAEKTPCWGREESRTVKVPGLFAIMAKLASARKFALDMTRKKQ